MSLYFAAYNESTKIGLTLFTPLSSRCQKFESSPIFVKKLEIRLYPEFLSTQTCTFSPQICTLGTQTCTLYSTIASKIFALTFLPHSLTTLVDIVLCIHVHKG